MFGSFVTKKDAPSDIDRLVVIKNLDDPKLDILRLLELWTMQGVTVEVSRCTANRVQLLVGLVDSHYVTCRNLVDYGNWMYDITTSLSDERCGFVVVEL